MSLELIIGPMFSGKTSELIRQYTKYKIAGKNPLAIKSSIDIRYDKLNITTHAGVKIPALSTDRLAHVEISPETTVICIDELQFYPDAYEMIIEYLKRNYRIICSCLNGNFKQEPFPSISMLIPYATNIIQLTSICNSCSCDTAVLSIRLSKDDTEIKIGGSDEYVPMCTKCYIK